jgi:stage V sporulation protein S
MEQTESEIILRVKNTSSVNSLGSALAHAVWDDKLVSLRAIGPTAVNIAIKAIAVARGFVAPTGIDLSCRPGFVTVEGDYGPTTAILLKVDAI